MSAEWGEAVKDFDVHGYAAYNMPDPGYKVGQVVTIANGRLARVTEARQDTTTRTWSYRFEQVDHVPAVSPDCAVGKHPACSSDGAWVEGEGYVPCECHCHVETIDVSAVDEPGTALIMARRNVGHLGVGTFKHEGGR